MPRTQYGILQPNASQSLVIARYLHRYRPQDQLLGVVFDKEAIISSSRYFNQIVSLQEFLHHQRIEDLIPTTARATKYLLEFGDVSVGAVTLTQAALRVFDKPWIIDHAKEVGIPTPKTWNTLDYDMLDAFPVFFKQRYEKGGGVRGIAMNRSEIPPDRQSELIFQELIESRGTYGVSFLADNGKLLVFHAHYEIESLPKEGGSAVIIQCFNDKRLINYTKKMVQSLAYSGWGLAEFKYCPRRDDYVFMEINAKFWASCEFAFINEPLFVKLLFDIESREIAVERMVFVDRAFSRGLPFVLKHLPYLFRGTMLRAHSGWFKSMVAGVIPRNLRQPLKRMWIRSRKA